MGPEFSVTKVEADPLVRDPVRTGLGAKFHLHIEKKIWPLDPAFSCHPVAFNTQKGFGLTVTGTFSFNAAWRVQDSKYIVTGTGPGNVKLQSDPIDVPLVGNEVSAKKFKLPGLIIAPFKAAGDWKWTIYHQIPTGHAEPAVDSTDSTLIEAYFFQGKKCKLFPYHIAELLRLVVLTMPEITAFEDADIACAYAKKIAKGIWDYGSSGAPGIKPLQYNCNGGAARYGSGPFGGEFRFGDWLHRVRPSCNCYDLAGIVQLSCSALGMKLNGQQDIPVINTKWVFSEPFGYVPPGPLFGWDDDLHRNCNSPFWKGPPGQPDMPWNYPDKMDPNRTRFWNHAWIEFTLFNEETRVLDVCHGVLLDGRVVLSLGQQNRDQFLRDSRDSGRELQESIGVNHVAV